MNIQKSHESGLVVPPNIAGTVVIVDGLPGCGKTMLTAIIGTLARVQLMKFNYHFEHVCALHHLNLIDENTAAALLRIQTDLDLHNGMMARDTNFRFSDLSSVWSHSKALQYLIRAFGPGDAAVISRIQRENPIFHLATHAALGVSEPIFAALGNRLRMVEVVRHPLYMLKQWYIWMPRAGVDPRMFGLWVRYGDHSVPSFAHGWEDLFLRSSIMDRSIYGIENRWSLGVRRLSQLSEEDRSLVMMIPFEKFVIDPTPFIHNLENFIGTTTTSSTKRTMKQQKVPRTMYAEGVGFSIYKQYGWEPPDPGATEQQELDKRMAFAESEASPEALAVLKRLCERYEAEYLPQ